MKIKITYVDESTEDIYDVIEIKWLEKNECFQIKNINEEIKYDVHSIRNIQIEE